MSDDRAVSSVLGIVMILGITLAAVTSLMVIGGVALQQSQEEAELSRMETSMAQMSSKASLTALGDAERQRFDLGEMRDGELEVQEHTGNVTIEYVHGDNIPDDDNTTELFHSSEFGALVYTVDGQEIAYQGGGVWKGSADDGGEMISPPEYHYRDETLTFPIINVTGDGSSTVQGGGDIRHVDYVPIFPDESYSNPLGNRTVYVEVESEYHRGWHTFFQSRSDGKVEHDPDNQTVRAELTAIYEGDILGPLSVQGNYDVHQNTDDSDFYEGGYYPSASTEIDNRIDDCSEENFNASETDYAGETTYCAPDDRVEFGEDLTIDTGGEEVDVILPGGINFDGNDVNIVDGGKVNFYVKDTIEFGNAEINQDGSADELSMFVHSDVDLIEESGNFDMTGLFYAPNTHLEFSGNVDIRGAVIADTLESDGNAASYTFDDSLDDVDLDIHHTEDEVRYLHVTENQIEIELD